MGKNLEKDPQAVAHGLMGKTCCDCDYYYESPLGMTLERRAHCIKKSRYVSVPIEIASKECRICSDFMEKETDDYD